MLMRANGWACFRGYPPYPCISVSGRIGVVWVALAGFAFLTMELAFLGYVDDMLNLWLDHPLERDEAADRGAFRLFVQIVEVPALRAGVRADATRRGLLRHPGCSRTRKRESRYPRGRSGSVKDASSVQNRTARRMAIAVIADKCECS